MLLPQIGQVGQERLASAHILLVGCGALGTTSAELLVRAGVGHLRIVDRDLVELSNLQRQVLFDEEDARHGIPKAVAAAQRLREVNSSVEIEARVGDVYHGNMDEFAQFAGRRVDLIVDGTDNVETRYLLNDYAVKNGVPWVYGACVGTEGRIMGVWPGATACLRCIFPQPPAPGELPTCDTAGVLGPAAAVVGAIQASTALRMLLESGKGPDASLLTLDVWANRFGSIGVAERREDCTCCGDRQFDYLDHPKHEAMVALCGRDAVQIRPARDGKFNFDDAVNRLQAVGQVERTAYLARVQLQEPAHISLTVFPDGRLVVRGTKDLGQARSIAARYVGC